MALEIKQQLRLSQQLVITPQLQQAIKLLQMTRMELQTLVQQELSENPMLEELESEVTAEAQENADEADRDAAADTAVQEDEAAGGEDGDEARAADGVEAPSLDEVGTKDGELKEPTDFDWENYLGTYNAPFGEALPAQKMDEAPSYENTLGTTESLQEHLLWQLHLSTLPERQQSIGREIIGNINDDGYLAATTEEIALKRGVTADDVVHVLHKIQQFDPHGVGARDLQECLCIQARLIGGEHQAALERIIMHHLHDLEHHHYAPIAKKLNLSMELARELASIVQHMEPKPGRPFTQENPQYILPDAFVVKLGDGYEVFLNEDGLPRLQVSNFYRQAMQQGTTVAANAKEYMQNKLRSALWLIKSIHQRQRTLYKVAKSIVKFQHNFLDHGVDRLHPMILRDVAEDIQMHESTVSRVTTNKYIHTPRGIFELKFFFNSSVQDSTGGDVASETVKNRIAHIIEKEDARQPLSDQAIVELLHKDNIIIARRTVAKYRDTLTIPSSAQRRRVDD